MSHSKSSSRRANAAKSSETDANAITTATNPPINNISELQARCVENSWYTSLVNVAKHRAMKRQWVADFSTRSRWQARFTEAKIYFGLLYIIGFLRAVYCNRDASCAANFARAAIFFFFLLARIVCLTYFIGFGWIEDTFAFARY